MNRGKTILAINDTLLFLWSHSAEAAVSGVHMAETNCLLHAEKALLTCSCIQGGVPKKHWDVLRREVLHTYGHEHILTLAALQDAGETF